MIGHMKELDRRIRQGGDDAIAAVSELLPRWISVEERLPEQHRHVIGWQREWANSVEVWIGTSGKWLGGDFEPAGNVSHWMPLPEPPEVTK